MVPSQPRGHPQGTSAVHHAHHTTSAVYSPFARGFVKATARLPWHERRAATGRGTAHRAPRVTGSDEQAGNSQ